eukprot:TCONS_00025388-protein
MKRTEFVVVFLLVILPNFVFLSSTKNDYYRTYESEDDLEKNLLTYALTELTPIETETNKSIEFMDIGTIRESYFYHYLRHIFKNISSEERFGFNMIIDGQAKSLKKTDIGFFLHDRQKWNGVYPDILIGMLYPRHIRHFITYQTISESIMFTSVPTGLSIDSFAKQFNIVGTHPSDLYRLEALTSFLKHLKWNFITLITSVDMEAISKRFLSDKEGDFCFGGVNFIDRSNCDMIQALGEMEEVSVMVLFTVVEDSRYVLDCMRELGYKDRFQLVFFYSHNTDYNVVHGNEELVDGTFSLRVFPELFDDFFPEADPDFYAAFRNLKLNGTNDYYLIAYWELRNECYGGSGFFKPSLFNRKCTFQEPETLQPVESWDAAYNMVTESASMLRLMFRCIYALLEAFLNDYCDGKTPCTRSTIGPDFKRLFAQKIRDILGEDMTCNQYRKFFGYIVSNPIKVESRSMYGDVIHVLHPQVVYYWLLHNQTGGLTPHEVLKTANIEAGRNGDDKIPRFGDKHWYTVPFGNCSHECGYGARKVFPNSGSQPMCCFDCVPCGKNEISNGSQCFQCAPDERANITTGTCEKLVLRTMQDVHATLSKLIFVLTTLLVGISVFLVIWIIHKRNGKMFNVSSTGYWFGLILSIICCLASNIVFIVEPNNTLCVIQTIAIPVTLIYVHSFVLMKAVRLFFSFLGFPRFAGVISTTAIELIIGLSFPVIGGLIACQQLLLNGIDLMKERVFHKLTTDEEFLVVSCTNVNPLIVPITGICALVTLVVNFNSRNIPNIYDEPWDLLYFNLFSLVCQILYVAVFYAYDYTMAMEYYHEVTCAVFLLAVCFMALANLFCRKIYFTIKGWEEPYQVRNGITVDRSQSFTAARYQETVN